MAQLFPPYANTIATASLFVAAGVPFVLLVAGTQITNSPANTKVDNPLDQPVPFSHKHHAKELGIDCRFCHSNVEDNAQASVPSTEVCMTCHSQIWTNSPMLDPVRSSWETGTPLQWNKVNSVPDFVYFNHSIHIDRGVNCNTCHGPVQEMPITWKGQAFRMSWCLDCHNDPAKFLVQPVGGDNKSPREQVFMLYRKVAEGRPLNESELALAEGLPSQIPQDETHTEMGKKLVKDRKINVQQLKDCYICHH